MGKTTGVDLGDMENFFSYILLISKDYIQDIQALGRDRDFFVQKNLNYYKDNQSETPDLSYS